MEILKEKKVYEGALKVERAVILNNDKKRKYERLKRENASVVCLLNRDTNKLVLLKQYRYPIHDQIEELIYEMIAGKIDEGESPLEAAIRETYEETGYRINSANIKQLFSCFSSPGYSSEELFIFYATVENSDKDPSHKLSEEDEGIETIEIKADTFQSLLKDGLIRDAKTYVAGLFMSNQWH
ncbi:MAG: NUDIX hydrolase [Bacteroidia bacterium]|nr:NUDIX hydrolase [Bacteroidia bacterium]